MLKNLKSQLSIFLGKNHNYNLEMELLLQICDMQNNET